MKQIYARAALLLCGAALFGCQPKTVSDTSAAADNAMRNTGTAMGNAANRATTATVDFTSNASLALSVTPKVKTALIADSGLADPANQIDVDSKDKVVHLKGHVKNNELKRKAGQIAKETLASMNAPDDVKVSNELLTR